MAYETNLGLIALTRFGYGPRGDGDVATAASDPRGFLEAELMQPGIALLSGATLPSTTSAIQQFFKDREIRKVEREQQADLALKAKQVADLAALSPVFANAVARAKADAMSDNSMSVNTASVKTASAGAISTATMSTATMAPGPTAMVQAKPSAPPPSPEQLIFRDEALARLRRAIEARAGLAERLVAFWSNHFCISANKGGISRVTAGQFRARSDPSACAGPLRRHAGRRRKPSGDAAFPRQRAIRRAEFESRTARQAGAEREPRPRDHGAAHAGGRVRLHPDRRHEPRAHHHLLVVRRRAGHARRTGHLRLQRQHARARPDRPARQDLSGGRTRPGPERAGSTSPAGPRRRASSPRNSRAPFLSDTPPQPVVDRLARVFHESGGDLRALHLRAARRARGLGAGRPAACGRPTSSSSPRTGCSAICRKSPARSSALST